MYVYSTVCFDVDVKNVSKRHIFQLNLAILCCVCDEVYSCVCVCMHSEEFGLVL